MAGPMDLPPHAYMGSASDLQALGMAIASGPDNNAMLAQFSLAGSGLTDTSVDKLFDNNVQPGTLTSNTFYTNKLGIKTEGYTEGDTWKECFIYAGGGTESQTTRKDLVHPIKSQPTFNSFLASEEGRRLTTNVSRGEELQSFGRVVGPLEVGPAGWQRDGRTTNFLTYVACGRARIKEITRAQSAASTSERMLGAVPNEDDSLWMLRLKCRGENPVKCLLDNSSDEIERRIGKKLKLNDGTGASMEYENEQGVPETYWNDALITTVNKTKPKAWMYTSRGDGLDDRSRWTGMCSYIGKIQSTEGKRVANEAMTHSARVAQTGGEGWKTSLNKLRNMEVMIADS